MSLPSGDYSPASITFRDAGNEPGVFRCHGAKLTAANFTAKQALWATLVSAVDALALGQKEKSVYGVESTFSWSQPVNGAAREFKLLVQYKDATTGQRLTCTIPTLDPTIPDYVININAVDVVELTSPGEITDFITAFEAFAVNPATTNAVVVIGLKTVGRNN